MDYSFIFYSVKVKVFDKNKQKLMCFCSVSPCLVPNQVNVFTERFC